MSEYPEHEKLSAVADKSQAIGEFLDFGLPRMGMHIVQRIEAPCECPRCLKKRTYAGDPTHSDAVKIEDGVAYYERYYPTTRSIQSMLAEWFGIDQKKVDEEKEAMLEAFRNACP